jgi:hypothetical protein
MAFYEMCFEAMRAAHRLVSSILPAGCFESYVVSPVADPARLKRANNS